MSFPELKSRNRLLRFLQEYLIRQGDGAVSFSAISTNTPTGQAIANNTITTVEFDTEVFAGTGYDTSNDTFTAPYDGKYYFHANVMWYNIQSTIGYISLGFKHNLTFHVVSFVNQDQSNFDEISQSGDIMLELSKNDTVVVQVRYLDAAESTEHLLGDGTHHYTQFFGYKV